MFETNVRIHKSIATYATFSISVIPESAINTAVAVATEIKMISANKFKVLSNVYIPEFKCQSTENESGNSGTLHGIKQHFLFV